MKRLTIFLFFMAQAYSMQESVPYAKTGSPSKVLSLRLLAFRALERNTSLSTSDFEWLIREVLSSENQGSTIFEKAQFVDRFKLKRYIPCIASDVAKFMDARSHIRNRTKDLLELQKLSSEMQRAIAACRKT